MKKITCNRSEFRKLKDYYRKNTIFTFTLQDKVKQFTNNKDINVISEKRIRI